VHLRHGRQITLLIVVLFVFAIHVRAANTIQLENAKPGTSDWVVANYASNHEIEGYASLTSVNRGGQIQFFVRTSDRNFTIDIFRTGWYGGTGGRRVASTITLVSSSQPNCSNDQVTGLIECAWTNPYTLQIPNDTADPTDWASGVYLAKLTGQTSGRQSYIVFVVRDDARTSDLLFQCSVNTYQAYNNWGGRSLYAYNSDFQARKVSFNRPYADSQGAGQYLFSYEYPAVRFLEREGYDVTYATDVDAHEKPNILLSHKGDLVFGHGEYWSWEIRANITAARDHGVGLGIFAANTCYWQVRYEPSAGGTADRTMVGYKNFALTEDPDYIGGNTSLYHLVTTNWRSTPVNMPEDALLGVMYGNVLPSGDIVVANASSWVFNGTGLQNGSSLAGLLGVEVDGLAGNTPAGTVLLSHSPYLLSGSTTVHYSDMTVYTASSGATVFATGTIKWSWGLDNYNGGVANGAAQQMTRNILARFIGTGSPLSLSSLALTSTSLTAGDSTTGTVTLSGPAPTGGVTVTLASDTTSAAQVPASVLVGSGASSAVFKVTTSSVSGATNVTLTANYSGARTAILTVKPASSVSVSSITLNPTSVTGGTSVTGTVTLTGAAPSGGATVTLSSSNTAAAQVNSSITVSAGAASTVFPVTTTPVASVTSATITGAYNGGSRNAIVTVNPSNAGVSFTPTSLTFSTQAVGTTSASQNIILTNTGTAPLNISRISITGAAAANFKTGVINCGAALAAKANCAIPVMFAPVSPGSLAATLAITDDAIGSPQSVALSGKASGIALMSSTNQTSATIRAGQTATFSLQLVPTAFTGSVAVSCSGAPTGTNCLVTPASIAVSGDAPAPLTVTVTTTAQAIGLPWIEGSHSDRFFWLSLAAFAAFWWLAAACNVKRLSRPRLAFALCILFLLIQVGCSGSTGTAPNNGANGNSGGGTPTGTSILTVAAVSGSTQTAIPLTLVVN
jgi:hypothetical protein